MPYDTPLVRRVLSLATAALFFFGVIGALAVEEKPDDSDLVKDRGGLSTTDSTAPAAVGASDPNAPATSLPAAAPAPAGGQPATTAAGGARPSGQTAIGPAKPPQPGTYRFTRTVTEDDEKDEEETDIKIEAVGTEGNVTRQKMVQQQDSATFIHTIAWAPDALRLELTRFEASFGGQAYAYDCDWNPDTVEFALPLAAGKTWTVDSRCTAEIEVQPGQKQTLTIHRTGNQSVTGQKRVDVGGTSVNVWVIEGKTTVQTSGAFNSRQESDGTIHMAPEYGLRVYQKEVTRGSQGDATVEVKLTSLKPR